MGGPVSPDNVHEKGGPVDGLTPHCGRRGSRSSELEERPGHAPDPRFLCSAGGIRLVAKPDRRLWQNRR